MESHEMLFIVNIHPDPDYLTGPGTLYKLGPVLHVHGCKLQSLFVQEKYPDKQTYVFVEVVF